ncbi:uncharacterized protein PRCAT00006229001 [Priceomyces carsonii]|uniref:uncharacterized protein n=1 Tax=Priceomyces carsonii TaxID=28549 RepID=UPI002ED90520|nr:unnamed protein product [Priceomyces carsonii]
MVLWSSWLWHLLNTQNVPSSILGRIIFFFLVSFSIILFKCFFLCSLSLESWV